MESVLKTPVFLQVTQIKGSHFLLLVEYWLSTSWGFSGLKGIVR